MSYDALIGQGSVVEMFRAVKRAGSIGHAYLIDGPPGSGKRTLAAALARALLCREDPAQACGQCSTCRKVAQGLHPDVVRMSLAEKARQKPKGDRTVVRSLGIDDVRELQRILPYPPIEGRFKVLIIEDAVALTFEAQNALLKSLEEPPSHNVFLVLAAARNRLLPTIQSRCQKVAMAPVAHAEVVRALRRALPAADQAALERTADLSGGWIGEALAIAQDPTWDEMRLDLDAALGGDALDVFAFARKWGQNDAEFRGPERFFRLVRELLARTVHAPDAPRAAFDLWARVQEAETLQTQNNVNARLTLETTLLRMQGSLGRFHEQRQAKTAR
jgi:DNA polymerase-3 subunit delta'